MNLESQHLAPNFRHLLSGIDTLEVCFYLSPTQSCALDFEALLARKEALRAARFRQPEEIRIGSESFLLQVYGSSSGYPLVFSNPWAVIAYGARNTPQFYVKFLSQGLWQYGWVELIGKFISWATDSGFVMDAPERVSRADFCFDYWLGGVDFNHDCFVSLSAKDANYREHRKNQTFDFGKGALKLRVYDKIAEIEQQSGKTFFFDLWKEKLGVWRIEWQVRKPLLKRFGVRTIEGLQDQAGDLLTYLSTAHDTLRIPTADSNRSRWPLHPLWQDVQIQAARYGRQGVLAEIDPGASLDERLRYYAISLYGYAKAVAAIEALKAGRDSLGFDAALDKIRVLIKSAHDPIAWKYDVAKKAAHLRLTAP
jgi:hypothetical protein